MYLSFIVLGLLATVAYSTILFLGIGFRLTRMNLPFILGTLFTLNRSMASFYGLFLHLLIGYFFTFIYLLIFSVFGMSSPLFGMLIGLLHGLFMLSVGTMIFPAIHFRMRSEEFGPQAGGLLEPPGFLGMNYGYFTPIFALAAHLAFGAVVGAYNRLPI